MITNGVVIPAFAGVTRYGMSVSHICD